MNKPKITAEPKPNVAEGIVDGVKSTYATILSITIVVILSIIVSGHLLGYVLGLKNNANDNVHITIPIPYIINFKAIGKYAIAGTASFLLMLLFVLLLMLDCARDIFIDKLAITDSLWVASETLASLVSVAACIGLAAIRLIVDSINNIRGNKSSSGSSDDEIIRTLTEQENYYEKK